VTEEPFCELHSGGGVYTDMFGLDYCWECELEWQDEIIAERIREESWDDRQS
jgi:hypothetical protein